MKNAKPISRAGAEAQAESPVQGRSDWARLRAVTDDDVEAAVRSDDDESGMVVDWQDARVVMPDRKQTMTIRLDADVLAYYRALGRGYQTTINAVLRSYMAHGRR